MRDELTVFQNLNNPNLWSAPFRGSPAKWKSADGEAIVRAYRVPSTTRSSARWASCARPRSPPSLSLAVRTPTSLNMCRSRIRSSPPCRKAKARHTEIQYLLTRLGADMGFEYAW